MQNLNRLTMTVDVDIYDEESQKVEIPAMPGDSPIKVIIYPCLSDCWQVETMRMKRKDYDGILRMPESHTVRVAERLKLIKVVRFFHFSFLFLFWFTSEEEDAADHLPQGCGQQDLFNHQLANQGLQPIQVG